MHNSSSTDGDRTGSGTGTGTGTGKDELAARIGATARELRKAAGITLSEVSRRAGMSVSHLSNVENGLTLVSLPMLAKLAAALNTSLADLTRDENFVFRAASIPSEPGAAARLSHDSLVLESEAINLAAGAEATVETAGSRDLFVYVLQGTLEVRIDAARHTLGTGDALDARVPQSIVLHAITDLQLIWATTPAVRLG